MQKEHSKSLEFHFGFLLYFGDSRTFETGLSEDGALANISILTFHFQKSLKANGTLQGEATLIIPSHNKVVEGI